jgi:hypothetical protein
MRSKTIDARRKDARKTNMDYIDDTPEGLAQRKADRMCAICVVCLVLGAMFIAGTWAFRAGDSARTVSMDACQQVQGPAAGRPDRSQQSYLCTNPGVFAAAK